MLFKLAVFDSIHDVAPKPLEIEGPSALETAFTPQTIKTRQDRRRCFSANIYRDGGRRGQESIEAMTGLVLDVDNKQTPLTEEALRTWGRLESHPYFFYPTWSYYEGNHRYRLVIPFAEPVACDARCWPSIYDALVKDFFPDHLEAFDRSARNCAQVWFSHYVPEGVQGGLILPSHFASTPPTLRPKSLSRLDRARDALRSISPDAEYALWIRVGMALHSEWPNDFALWDDWSRGGSKYPGEGVLRAHWASFKPQRGVSLGTLFHEAQQRGAWRDPGGSASPATDAQHLDTEPVYDFAPFDRYPIFDIPDEGLKLVYEFLLNYGRSRIPVYALAGAIALDGFLKRNQRQLGVRERTAYQVQVVGDSGSGKTTTIKFGIQVLLNHVKQTEWMIDQLKTVQGAIRAINDRTDKSMIVIHDEVGFDQREHSSRTVNPDVLQTKQFYMKAADLPPEIQSGAVGKEKITRVSHPFVTFVGMSTPEAYAYYRSEDFLGGFWARRLFFCVESASYPKHPECSHFSNALLDYLRQYSLVLGGDRTMIPTEIDPEATEFFNAFEMKLQHHTETAREEGDDHGLFIPLFQRATHLAQRLALLVAQHQNNQYTIQKQHAQWACSVVLTSIKNQMKVIRCHVSSSIWQEQMKKIESILLRPKRQREGGWVLMSTLCQFSNLRKKNVLEIIDNLLVQGKIQMAEGKPHGTRFRHHTLIPRETEI